MIHSQSAITTDEVAAHYDSLDIFYRHVWGDHVHHGYWETGRESREDAILHLSRVLGAWLKVKAGDAVCDIGCGYGGTSRFLAETYGAQVTGYTVSRRQKEYADGIVVERGSVAFHCEDFLLNRQASDSFDAVISIECLEHIQDKKAVFNEAFRILKPGGSMALAVWAACEQPNRVQRRLLEAICQEGRLPSLPSGKEYEHHMLEAGFQIEEMREIGEKVRRTWAICAGQLAYRIACDSRYRNFLRDPNMKDRIFALTVFRILGAFHTRTMRYWIYEIKKPSTTAA